jgi:hypothetical protein
MMSAYNYVGADGSYPEVAAHAVQSASQQSPSPVYGYLRSDLHQRVYLFGTIEDAHGWLSALSQPYDYAAVFVAADLTRPVPGLESFGHSTYVGATDAELVNRATDDQFYAMYPERRHRPLNPSDPADRELIAVWKDLHRQTAERAQSLAMAGDAYVGQWPLFLLGAMGGGAAGYFLRRWQEQNPGRALPLVPAGKLTAPKIPPDASVSPTKSAGDYVGQSDDVTSASNWSDIRGLIRSSINAVIDSDDLVDQIARLVMQHLAQQGVVDPAYVNRFLQTDWQRSKPYLRGAWHASVNMDPMIDAVARSLSMYMSRHPGHAQHPRVQGHPYVGGPWLDMVGPQVGGPWLDMVGPQVGGPWLDIVSGSSSTTPDLISQLMNAIQQDDQEAAQGLLEQIAHLAAQGDPAAAHVLNDIFGEHGADPQVGGPWLDVVGPHVGAWPETRALIESAKREAVDANSTAPAAAWVWSLDPSGPSLVPGVQLVGGTTMVTPFSSYAQALDYMRSRAQTPHVALALFDTTSSHWPNPVSWTKSDDPAYEQIIAQRASPSPRMAGSYGSTTVGTALDDLRSRAESLAAKRAGAIIGVIHTSKDGLWHTLAFRSEDDADDWLDTSTQDPTSYTYASYFNKSDPRYWPHAVIEKVSGMRSPPGTDIRRPVASGRWAA